MRKLEWSGGAQAAELQGAGDGVGLLVGGWLLPQCVGGDSPTRNAVQLGGERNRLGAHWPVGEYLVPHSRGGKAQGGQRLHLQGHAGGAWLSRSPPAPESLGLR